MLKLILSTFNSSIEEGEFFNHNIFVRSLSTTIVEAFIKAFNKGIWTDTSI